MGHYEQLAINFWQDVPFFNFAISPTTFTFLMQGLIILTLLITAYRKWRNQSLPAFPNFQILLYLIFQTLLLGSLWSFYGKGDASGLIGHAISSSENSPLHENIGYFILVTSVYIGLSLLHFSFDQYLLPKPTSFSQGNSTDQKNRTA